ncbi:MAG: type II secretion system secretin GspD [Rhodanobacteraceae bacterium]|nr:type II secretion system secretin GspD [Rhodanobacteraceae bacterium]MBK7044180.1 type II secretion system secretin GspD [Rhodanobacteraceae bacterium]MBP9154370.1 type II secretion system secretin GspD [Xanthomonadales bacterium]HQW80716.1 type II secretion system secretin GspD [Pseudomonadota bacterium]
MSPRPLALLVALAFVAPLAAQQQAPGAPLLNGKNTLNLKDADVRTFISTVSEITGKNFIVDPRVEGKVNVISTQPMDKDEVYRVFESVLRVHGFALVPAGDVIKVLPEAVAVQDGAASSPVIGPDSLTTRVIPLKYVSPNALLTVLRPLIPQSGQIVASPSGNAIIVTDRAGNVARIESIISRIDTISDSAVEAIPLQHANAQEVAATLNKLGGEVNGAKSAMVVADARTNSILLSGESSARLKARAMITHLDTPLDAGESTQVVYLRYADAEQLVALLDTVAATLTGGSTAKDAARAATIQAHKDTNSLIITAAPAVFRSLQSVIRSLDVRRAQVLIEALIAEVSDETAREIGIQWQATDGLSHEGVVGGTNFPTAGNGGIVGAITNPLGALGAGLNLGYITGTTTITGANGEPSTVYEVGALAKLLRGDSRSNILSEPSIVTLDNKEATIKVGQEVPFLTGQYTNTGSNGGGANQPTNPFQTIERKDVGLTLKVTPHINEGDEVALDLNQIVSSLAPSVDGASDLITNNREISTSVLVKDGGMLVLGGLTSHEMTESISKVPALGDIPLLGNLFKYRKATMVKRNLMIFLRPRILRDASQEAIISQEKYNFLRAEQLRINALPGNATPEHDQPLMPAAPTIPLGEMQ